MKFVAYVKKVEVFNKRKLLKGTTYFITEDLTATRFLVLKIEYEKTA